MNFEFGENLTCELNGRHLRNNYTTTSELSKYQIGLSSSTKVLRHWPESASHNRLPETLTQEDDRGICSYINPSIAHDTIRLPSRLKLTAVTGSEWAGRTLRDFPAKQIEHVRHRLRRRSSHRNVPLATSHILTVSSNPPEANKLDLWLKLTQKTKFVCPFNTFTVVP